MSNNKKTEQDQHEDKHNTRKTGSIGEDIAVTFLEENGYTVLDRNYAFERSEVDIVAYNQKEIIFVEVKMRSSLSYGRPEDAVTEEKKKSIYKAAEAWMYERKMEGAPVRFDVVAIMKESGEKAEIDHFENAFFF